MLVVVVTFRACCCPSNFNGPTEAEAEAKVEAAATTTHWLKLKLQSKVE